MALSLWGLAGEGLRIIDIPAWEFQRPTPLRGRPTQFPSIPKGPQIMEWYPVSLRPEDEVRLSLITMMGAVMLWTEQV